MGNKRIPVKEYNLQGSMLSPEVFEKLIGCHRKPAVLKGLDLGPCVSKWSTAYLTETVDSSKKVKVHRSKSPKLDFLVKNFVYETVSFNDLVTKCSDKGSDHCDYWYLRSLGIDARGKDLSDITIHFPELASDIIFPQVFDPSAFFSSVFRISSPNLQLWTHYDTCDNILMQIRGKKRVVFFPPDEALNLYLQGDKSSILDIDNPDLRKYPLFQNVQSFETVLNPGDIVFIPSLWFHNITALDFSVSVNVFWKNFSAELYDNKDTYGNRDLIPAQLSLRTFEKSIKQLKKLPRDHEHFYYRRMIIILQEKLKESLDTSAIENVE